MSWLGNSYPYAHQVQIYTKTDRTFRGVLWQRRGEFYILKRAEELRERGAIIPLDGEVLIDRANVDFMQVIGVSQP